MYVSIIYVDITYTNYINTCMLVQICTIIYRIAGYFRGV